MSKQDVLRFLLCARDPLQRSAWSMLKTEDFLRLRPSVEICVVDVQSRTAFLRDAFAIAQSRVRFSSGPRQLRLENRNYLLSTKYTSAAPAGEWQLLSTKVIRGNLLRELTHRTCSEELERTARPEQLAERFLSFLRELAQRNSRQQLAQRKLLRELAWRTCSVEFAPETSTCTEDLLGELARRN